MNKPHKHAAVIKAWADGAEIEFLNNSTNSWQAVTLDNSPLWSLSTQYRVKPKPRIERIRVALMHSGKGSHWTMLVSTDEDAVWAGNMPAFRRWLCDWQEIELPEPVSVLSKFEEAFNQRAHNPIDDFLIRMGSVC